MWRIFALAAVTGCNVGSQPIGDDMPPPGDAKGNEGLPQPPDWPDAPAGGDGAAVACVNNVPNPPDGHHFSGRDCLDGCHNHGFTLAGTLYTTVSGNAAFVGATISILDANAQAIDLVVRTNGNFYTSQPIAFPVRVRASSCPVGKDMQATSANGRCNSTGCHAQVGGVQMHLP